MFSFCGCLISSVYKRSLSTFVSNKFGVKSSHTTNYRFRPVLRKIQRYSSSKRFSSDMVPSVKTNKKSRSDMIEEIMDSPDKIERDHKDYRSVRFHVNCLFSKI